LDSPSANRLFVDCSAEHLACFKIQYFPGSNLYFLTGLGIPAPTGVLFLDDKISEPRNLNLLALRQVVFDDLKHRLNNGRLIFFGKSQLLIHIPDDIELCHHHSSFLSFAGYCFP